MERTRLVIAMVVPTVLVAVSVFLIRDVRAAYMMYVVGGCLLFPWVLTGVRPFRGDGLPFRSQSEHPASSLVALLIFGPCFLLVYGLLRKVITAPEPYLDALRTLGWNDDSRYFYFAVFLATIPLAEEWWWRGQALPRAERLFGAGRGRAMVALGFASYHAPVLLAVYPLSQAAIRFAGIVFAGFVWTGIAARRRSWGWVFWAHLAADVVIVLAFIWWVQPQA